jgi:hypothetical protein
MCRCVLSVHTDKLKPFQTRAGQPFDDRATSDERFFRYDDLLIDIMMISDPQYLARPWIYSKMYERVPQGAMAPYLCTPNDEAQRLAGRVPMHLPGNGEQFIDGPVEHGIPVKSALGGSGGMYPEYQDTLKTLPANPTVDQIGRAEQKGYGLTVVKWTSVFLTDFVLNYTGSAS